MKSKQTKKSRKIAFVLGAGASFGAGAYAKLKGRGRLPIPMQTNFWDAFLRFTKSAPRRKRIEKFLFHYFTSAQKVPPRSSSEMRRKRLVNIDVEEVFTFLSERLESTTLSKKMRKDIQEVQQDMLQELGNLFRRFPANEMTKKNFRTFRKLHMRARDSVISFNYDTVFENSIPSDKWHYRTVEENEHSTKVFKPHGSINWEKKSRSKIVVNEAVEVPLIVAPSHLKFIGKRERAVNHLGELDGIGRVWDEMEKELRDVKVVVFIGYSFPSADLYFSSVLRMILAYRASAPGIVIVNPEAPSISERLKRRFAVTKISTFFDLDSFVRSNRQNVLAALGIK